MHGTLPAAGFLSRWWDDISFGGGVCAERERSPAECDGVCAERGGGCVYAGRELSAGGDAAFGVAAGGDDDGGGWLVHDYGCSGRDEYSTGDCVGALAPADYGADDDAVCEYAGDRGPDAVFRGRQAEGDIPLFAVATGSVDSVECVLRKVGVADSEFTNPSGGGRIQIYQGSGSPGARIDTTTQNQSALMSDPTVLNKYDVLMLPCEGGAYPAVKTAAEYANLLTFANSGGRVYGSHYAYQWMYQNGPFSGVANWTVNQGSYPDGTATVNQGFSGGLTLAQWLQQPVIAASTTQGQIAINTLKHDTNGVIAPTQLWLSLNATNSPVMQFVFDTPIAAQNQCGRVLYNEYHVESNSASASQNVAFPQECNTGTMTPQEKLLEFMLFELTDEGGAASLTPATQDFGDGGSRV